MTSYSRRISVGFEVSMAVVMKSFIFWDITPCSPLKVNRRFGGTSRLHLQGRKTCQVRTQHEAGGNCYMFLRNVIWLSTGYTAFYPRRYNSSLFFNYEYINFNETVYLTRTATEHNTGLWVLLDTQFLFGFSDTVDIRLTARKIIYFSPRGHYLLSFRFILIGSKWACRLTRRSKE
jgi:hypothetical protein